MLVLTRKIGEEIEIGDDIRVVVLEVHGKKVRLGLEASRNIPIRRSELEPSLTCAGAKTEPKGNRQRRELAGASKGMERGLRRRRQRLVS